MDASARRQLHPAHFHQNLTMLEQLEQQQAQFIRVVVHELKSPVAGAKMLIDALRSHRAVTDANVISLIERISNRMGQMCNLVKYLLELSQPAPTQTCDRLEPIDLCDQTRHGCDPYREQAELKGLDLHIDLPNEAIPVAIDARGYRLVLSNLVSNAIKYTSEGSVHVSVQHQDGQVELKVTDTGIGIPRAEVHNLFREFFRASNAKASAIEGSGVGLSGTKALVQRLGGTLTCQTREHVGSTFTVSLPTASETGPAVCTPAPRMGASEAHEAHGALRRPYLLGHTHRDGKEENGKLRSCA